MNKRFLRGYQPRRPIKNIKPPKGGTGESSFRTGRAIFKEQLKEVLPEILTELLRENKDGIRDVIENARYL